MRRRGALLSRRRVCPCERRGLAQGLLLDERCMVLGQRFGHVQGAIPPARLGKRLYLTRGSMGVGPELSPTGGSVVERVVDLYRPSERQCANLTWNLNRSLQDSKIIPIARVQEHPTVPLPSVKSLRRRRTSRIGVFSAVEEMPPFSHTNQHFTTAVSPCTAPLRALSRNVRRVGPGVVFSVRRSRL